MNALHDALHRFIRLSSESNSDHTKLAAQLAVLQSCFSAGMSPEQIARLLTVLFEKANAYVHRAQYVRQELDFETNLLALGLDRRTMAIHAVGDTLGTDADWALSDTRTVRQFS